MSQNHCQLSWKCGQKASGDRFTPSFVKMQIPRPTPDSVNENLNSGAQGGEFLTHPEMSLAPGAFISDSRGCQSLGIWETI